MERINNDDIFEGLNLMAKELKNIPGLVLINPLSLRYPCNEQMLDLVETTANLKLDQYIKSFYLQHNGLNISWVYNKKYKGEITILPIDSTILGNFDNFWIDALKRKKAKQDKVFLLFCESIASFESYEETTDGTLRTVFEFQRGTDVPSSPNLWIWHLAGEKFPLTLDFNAYCQKLLITRGFLGWTYFFIDLDKCRFEDPFFAKYFAKSCVDAIPRMNDFLTVMPKIFPQENFSEFETLQAKILEYYKNS